MMLFVGFLAFCVTVYIMMFASTLYLEVPAQLGGGRERLVGFALKSLPGNGPQSESQRPRIVCRLYAETSTTYVVSADNPELLAAIVGPPSNLPQDIKSDPRGTLQPNFILLPKEAVSAVVILKRIAPSK
jgi:hypothetical protein